VHQGVHRNLLAKINSHALEFRNSGKFSDALFVFLHMWLRAHICGVDRKYADHVHARQAS
jgi:hemerythrin